MIDQRPRRPRSSPASVREAEFRFACQGCFQPLGDGTTVDLRQFCDRAWCQERKAEREAYIARGFQGFKVADSV